MQIVTETSSPPRLTQNEIFRIVCKLCNENNFSIRTVLCIFKDNDRLYISWRTIPVKLSLDLFYLRFLTIVYIDRCLTLLT
jgi:hypothetical protein